MENLIRKIGQFKAQGLPKILFIGLGAFPILRPAMQSVLILLFCLSCLLIYRFSLAKLALDRKNWALFFFLTGYYIWHIFSAAWSDNPLEALLSQRSNLLLILFPVVFIFFKPHLGRIELKGAKVLFIISMMAYFFLLLNYYTEGISYYQINVQSQPAIRELSLIKQLKFLIEKQFYWVSGISLRGFRAAEVTPKLFLHHGYISAFFLVALLFVLQFLQTAKGFLRKLFLFICLLTFLAALLYLPSMINKLATILAVSIFFLTQYPKKLRPLFIAILVVITLGISTVFSENFREIRLFESESLISDKPAIIDFFRYHIYQCIVAILPENFLIGMGAGDLQPYLNQCLPQLDWPGLQEGPRIFNAHSQFLHFLATSGLVGLLLFILLWIRLYAAAFTRKSWMLFLVLSIVFLNCLFENFLVRVWGAYLFMFTTFLFLSTEDDNSSREICQAE